MAARLCPRCEGDGGWWIGSCGNETEEICEECNGEGEVEDDE